jgi:rhodanese-related sulfurtransferase
VSVTQENGIELAPERLDEWLHDGEIQLVDVREPREFEAGHVPGSKQIGFDEVTAAAERLDKGRPLVLVCRSGNRSEMVAEAFRGSGFDAYHLTGGLLAWAEAELPLEPEGGEVVERSIEDL